MRWPSARVALIAIAVGAAVGLTLGFVFDLDGWVVGIIQGSLTGVLLVYLDAREKRSPFRE